MGLDHDYRPEIAMKLPFSLPLLCSLAAGLMGLGQAAEPRPPATAAIAPPPAAPAPAEAEEGANPPMVTVDLKPLIETDPKVKDARDKLDADRDAAKKELDDRMHKRNLAYEEIRKLDATIAKNKQAITAQEQTRWIRGAKAVALKTLDDEIRDFQAGRQKGLLDSATRLQNRIVDDINKAVAARPSFSTVAFLLDKNGLTMNGLPFVVYSATDLDRSGVVQRQLGVEKADDAPKGTAGSGLNLAVVDLKKIFASYYKTKEAETEINTAQAAAKQNIDSRMATYVEAGKTLKAIEDELAGVTLVGAPRKAKSTERNAKAAELKTMEKEIQDAKNTAARENEETSTRLRTAIVDDINRVISERIKADGHIGLVLDAGGPGFSGLPILLRVNGIPDWTESVIGTLNNAKPGAKKSAAEPAVGSAPIAGLKFAVIDTQRVFAAIASTKAADKALAEARDKAKPSSAADADAAAKLKELEDLATKKRKEVLEKISKVLADESSKSAYQGVFDSSANGSTGAPFVLAGKSVPDLSEEIIAALRETTP